MRYCKAVYERYKPYVYIPIGDIYWCGFIENYDGFAIRSIWLEASNQEDAIRQHNKYLIGSWELQKASAKAMSEIYGKELLEFNEHLFSY